MVTWVISSPIICVCNYYTGNFKTRYPFGAHGTNFYQLQWLPESARFHVTSGQNDKALATLEQIAKDNKKSMLLGRLVVEGPTGSRGSFKALLGSSLRRTTLLLWFIWYLT